MKYQIRRILAVFFLSLAAALRCASAETDSKSLESEKSTHTISLRAKIDGAENLVVQDGKLYIHHTGWEKPTDLSIGGRKWLPAWTEDKTEMFSSFESPLAPFKDASVKVRAVRGRGTVTISETPSEADGYKLVVRIVDEPGGADDYYIRITWEPQKPL